MPTSSTNFQLPFPDGEPALSPLKELELSRWDWGKFFNLTILRGATTASGKADEVVSEAKAASEVEKAKDAANCKLTMAPPKLLLMSLLLLFAAMVVVVVVTLSCATSWTTMFSRQTSHASLEITLTPAPPAFKGCIVKLINCQKSKKPINEMKMIFNFHFPFQPLKNKKKSFLPESSQTAIIYISFTLVLH